MSVPYYYQPSLSTGIFGSYIYPTNDYQPSLSTGIFGSYIYPTNDDYKQASVVKPKERYYHNPNEQKHESEPTKTQPVITGSVSVGAPMVKPKQKWMKQEISSDFNDSDKKKLTAIMSKAHTLIKSDGGFNVKLKRGNNGTVTKGNFVALNGILKALGVAEQFMGAISPMLQTSLKTAINNMNLNNRSDLKFLSKLNKNSMTTTSYLQKGINSTGLNFKCDVNFDEYVKDKKIASKEIAKEIGKMLNIDPSLVKVMELTRGSAVAKIKIPNAAVSQSYAAMNNSYNYAYKDEKHVLASIQRTKNFETMMKALNDKFVAQEQAYDDAKEEVERLEQERDTKKAERDDLNQQKDAAYMSAMTAMTSFNQAKNGYDGITNSLEANIVRVTVTSGPSGTDVSVGQFFEEDDDW
eukprot:460564_1